MSTETKIRLAISAYDGRALSTLSEAAARFNDAPDYLDAVIALVANGDALVSEGATWMLKAEIEAGRTLGARQTTRLIKSLGNIATWQGQLHICQIVSRLKAPAPNVAALRSWLRPLLDAERPFLRAWAVDALCRLPGTKIETLLARMADDPAASVRARVRNLRAEMAKQKRRAGR